jgi:uncharacterized protein
MKAQRTPLEIELHELPPDGREFTYDRQSGELNGVLKDLVGTNDYQVRFKLTPMGNTYDLRGEIQTQLDLQCSLCAIDFKFPVKSQLHELIVIQKPLGKRDHQGRANHVHELEESGPDYIVLESGWFNAGEYIHEMVALAEPIRPLGKPNCDENCENLKDRVQREWLSFGPGKNDDLTKQNPFQVLEKIKLKS